MSYLGAKTCFSATAATLSVVTYSECTTVVVVFGAVQLALELGSSTRAPRLYTSSSSTAVVLRTQESTRQEIEEAAKNEAGGPQVSEPMNQSLLYLPL